MPRRKTMPQSQSPLAGFAPADVQKNDIKKILERLRKDAESNPEVSAMTNSEILERFRSDIKRNPIRWRRGETGHSRKP
jgi:hypothetical protein